MSSDALLAALLPRVLSSARTVLVLCDEALHVVETVCPPAAEEGLFDRAVPGLRLPEAIEAPLRAAAQQVEQNGQPCSFEAMLDGAKGPLWYQVNVQVAAEGVTTLHRYVLLVRDISRQKRREQALSSEAEFAQRLMDHLPGLVFLFRPDGDLLMWNTGLEEATGYSRDEMGGRSIFDFFHERGHDQVRAQIALVIRQGQGEAEGLMMHRSGVLQPFFFRTRLFAYRGQSCLLGVGTDIAAYKQALRQLEESEARFRVLFEQVPSVAVQGYDRHRKVIFWNDASAALYGYSREEALGRPLEQLIIPDPMREEVKRAITSWYRGGAPIPPGELVLQAKDGSRVPVFSSHVMIRNSRGEQEMYCLDVDMSELRSAQTQLRLSDAVFRDSRAGIMVTDASNTILTVNPAFTTILGYQAKQVLGLDPRLLASGRHDRAFFDAMWQTLRDEGYWQGEVWNRCLDGQTVPLWMGISAVREASGAQSPISHYVAIFSDISAQKAIEARLNYLSFHDALTGLPNRVLASDRVEQALAHATREHHRLALMLLDLDQFKFINDSLGHAMGDRLLQAVVARIQDCVASDATISRHGGDEFIVALPEVRDSAEVIRIAESVLARMSEPIHIEGTPLLSSFSIGIAMYPEDGANFDALLLKADTAMYHAKEAGRNTYRFFTEQMNANAHERLALQTKLKQGIERGELLLHFQPQIDMISGAVIGAEALVRWKNPELGLVSPARFIPVAEESGLIIPIGEWVMHEACRQAQAWRDAGLPDITIAINMSALQFKRSDPVETVTRILADTGLPAACLELELTESILISDAESILGTLNKLKALGVQLAVDDFGTGYSSLAYLKKFPIDKLKVDQSFVRDIATDPDDAAIVRAIIQLGRSLKLVTVAEGVETAAQLLFLRGEGCHEAQGYYFSRPLPSEDFIAFFRSNLAERIGQVIA